MNFRPTSPLVSSSDLNDRFPLRPGYILVLLPLPPFTSKIRKIGVAPEAEGPQFMESAGYLTFLLEETDPRNGTLLREVYADDPEYIEGTIQ